MRRLLKAEMLHPLLRGKPYDDFSADHLDTAVLEAFKTVEIGDGRDAVEGTHHGGINAAERAVRGLALGRRSWLFAGSDHGGARAEMTRQDPQDTPTRMPYERRPASCNISILRSASTRSGSALSAEKK